MPAILTMTFSLSSPPMMGTCMVMMPATGIETSVPMVAEMVETAAAQAKGCHGGYENEFDGITLHILFYG